jgi:raffinose/stachyose/melibiose transport system substrate-binding protein
MWSWFTQSDMEFGIKAFEAQHPNITVKYTYYNYSPQFLTALKTAAATGTLPDLIGLQPGSLTQQYRADLTPLSTLAASTWGANWTKLVYPVDLRQMTMGNPAGNANYYILPLDSQVIGIWYDTQLFSQLHLSVPTTLAQLVSDCRVLTNHGYLPMYQGGAGSWQNENLFMTLADQNSANSFENAQLGKISWTSAPLVNAMATWKALFTDGVFQSGALGDEGYPTGADLFAAGRVGMVYFGSWWLQEAEFPPPLPPLVVGMKGFGYFPFPAVAPGNKPGAIVGGIDEGVGLTTTGAKNPAAWQFMASIVNGAGTAAILQKGFNDLPSFTNAKNPTLAPRVMQLYRQQLSLLAVAQNQRFYSPVVQNALDNALAAVAAGQSTPAAALGKVESAQHQAG